MPCLLLLALTSGCARFQTFRVVDSQSGRPVSGIQAERLDASLRPSAMPLVILDEMSPVERGSSDTSGVVKFEKPGKQFAFNPCSQNPACGRAYAAATWSGVKIRYPDENREVLVKPINGIVEVPLPKPGPQKDSKADRRQRSDSASLANRPAWPDSELERR